jgi:hypothetical protein
MKTKYDLKEQMAENKVITAKKELKRIKDKRICVFDVETWKHAVNFAFGVVVYTDRKEFDKIIRKKVFFDANEMRDFLLSKELKNYKIYSHNGSRFDYITLFGNYVLDNTDILLSGSMIMEWYLNERYFYDSYALLRSSVKKIGEALGMEKLETSEKFIEGVEGQITEYDIEYCIRDCEIILQALINIVKLSKEINLTIASQSMNMFRRSMKKPIVVRKELDKEFIKSYRGGRVECFYVGEYPYAYVHDVNSMYPYVMVNFKFPNPAKFVHLKLNKSEFDKILNNYEGMVKIKVKVTTDKVGVLPYKHNGRLCFPKGIFEGYYNLNEIRYPYEKGYIEILDVYEGIVAEPIEPPFKNFILNLYEQRKKYKEINSNFYDMYFKYLMNSLYGKFGQKPKNTTYYFSCFENAEKFAQLVGQNEISKINEYFFVTVKNNRDPLTSVYSFASYITSASRTVLFQYMDLIGFENVLYCDTDSIISTKKFPEKYIGNELGQLKLEEEGRFIGVKSKFYCIKNKTKLKGGRFENMKVDGNKIIIDDNFMYFDGQEMGVFNNEREKLVTPKEAMRNKNLKEKLGYFEKINKIFDMIDTKRVFVKMNDFTKIIQIY